jgi:hypothetical protein
MPIRHGPIRPNAQFQARADPYFEWAYETDFAYLFSPRVPRSEREWLPVMIQLEQPATAMQFANGDWNPPPDWREWIRVPAIHAHLPAELRQLTYCTAQVTARFFAELSRPGSALSAVVRRVKLGLPLQWPGPRPPTLWERIRAALCGVVCRLLGALGFPCPPPPGPGVPDGRVVQGGQGTVVVGIIDDGLAFAHNQVQGALGSRIEFFWNQDGPEGFSPPFGWELDKARIDALLAANTFGGLVDEDQVYRRAGHLDLRQSGHKPIGWRIAHGTHIMDLASGFNPAAAPADRPLICVQLPVAATADSSGGTLELYAYLALLYTAARAGTLPLVVNLSYGFIAGPHDGSGFLEHAMDELIAARRAVYPTAVVLPAGNSYLARCHARFSLGPAPDPITLRWRIQPDDKTPSYLEIWLPHVGGPAVTVQVTSPTGHAIPPVGAGLSDDWQTNAGVLCSVVYYDTVASGRNRNMILITVAPTASLQPGSAVAPSGVWSVTVRNASAAPIEQIDAWIERDDNPYGFPVQGRQSYFDDPDYRRFDAAGRAIEDDNIPMSASYVKRDGTINSIATGAESVVMGGFQRKLAERSYFSALPSLVPAKTSAGGRLVAPSPHRDSPDAMAVSQDAPAYHGVLAAGARSGSTVAMTGTSVAAPQITRWIADQMAAGLAYDRAAVQALAQFQEGLRPPPNPQPQPERMGEGRIIFPPHVMLDRFEP